MCSLFEVKKVLSISKPGSGFGVSIQLSAYTESKGRTILALVCDNGYLLFRYENTNHIQPVMRQLSWFRAPGKQIKALSFDPSGTWILLVTFDASLYILPVLPLLEVNSKVPHFWRTDNVTEIKLTGQRAPLTSVRWWQTLQGQHIAVIGSELGEIAFVNLLNKKEVGGTYITVGISALDILNDESHDTTYLLITGNNRQQWRLLLEEKRSNFYWPFNSEIEVMNCNGSKGLLGGEKMLLSTDEKESEPRPHRLSKFESGTFLTPQSGGGRNLVSAYNSSSSLLQVLEGDLDQMHLFSYKVPTHCENIILSDKLIFITQSCSRQYDKEQSMLKILSRKFAEVCSENSKKKEHQNAEIQTFVLDSKILAIYKRIVENSKCYSVQKSPSFDERDSSYDTHKFSSFYNTPIFSENAYASGCDPENVTDNLNTIHFNSQGEFQVQQKLPVDLGPLKGILDGCYIILKDAVWECKQRIHPEMLFLSLTSAPADLPLAEKLGVMLGLDIHKLYEVAADMQLACGQFPQAVHLYQLSKCPQLKRVAHFMSYGYLSELIAYIQVLFSTKGVEIVSADKCHFANIALHCFAQQTMEKVQERLAITIAFKKFLRDNTYYDEEVAVKLLAEQGLYDLLYYFSKVRGQHGLMVETLLQTGSIRESVDHVMYNALLASGYENILLHSNNDDYMLCMTSFHILQFLAAKPSLLSQHIQHLITLLPKMNITLLSRVASLYDPSRCVAKLALGNIALTKQRHRYWSSGSLTSVSNEMLDFIRSDKEHANEEDFIKFFIFVLLMLCHKLNKRKFNEKLLLLDVSRSFDQHQRLANESFKGVSEKELLKFSPGLLACGLAHVAFVCNGTLYTWGKAGNGRLGNGDLTLEYQYPQPVSALMRLQVKVLDISCGAAHTLALTDSGVFGWGSSRYGQLGAGEVQRTCHPIIIESLLKEQIVAVRCGQYHSLALTKDGRVYSWGWGVHGQLGHGDPEDINLPKLIEYLKMIPIIALGAGQGHSILLTKTGEIYTFGCGMFGQLGTGSVLKQSLPQLVRIIPEPIVLMASGYFHTVVVGKSNKIYMWGCNPQALRLQAQCSRRARQQISSQNLNVSSQSNHNLCSSLSSKTSLSRSSPSHVVLQQTHLVPTLVDSSSISVPISQISCGSHHSILVTTLGEIYSWGRNMEGQIGNGTRREQKTPCMMVHLSDRKIVHAACGADFSIAVDSSGKVWGWGQNDGGQVGQKPSESSLKSTSTSSSGRVITIRTNRRMITITQPCRQGLLKPVEIIIPNDEVKIGELDSGSFENEYSISQLYQGTACGKHMQTISGLSTYDDPSYGPYALHIALKEFHGCCDSLMLLNHCLSLSDFQAAAKVCALENLYAQALDYQLKAVSMDASTPSKDYLFTALNVIEFYSRMIDPENTETNQNYLNHVIQFWMENNLQIHLLEAFFQKHLDLFSYPLSLLLFKNGLSDREMKIQQKFLSLLSTPFCLSITTAVINQIKRGCHHHFELMEQLMSISGTSSLLHQIRASDALTAWNDSIPPKCLWHGILHNVQKGVISHAALQLTASDVDILTKSLITERLCNHQPNIPSNLKGKNEDHGKDTIVFSCGHHYTMQFFRATVLSGFRESILKLPYQLPQTLKLLLSGYHSDGIISAACPKCVFNEIKSEL